MAAILNKAKFNKQLGQRIKQIRIEKGVSMKSFEAHEGAIDRSDLSKIENGLMTPSTYTLYKISRVLDVDIRYFFDKIRER
jgi:transcriptional regulator with XRE-family HTH domain